MTIRQACMYMMMSSGILLHAGGAVQAQIGSGSGSGGAIGQGSPDIKRGSGSTKEFSNSKKQGHESSGKMGKDSLGRPSGAPTNPGIGTANGSDSGTGAGSGSRGDTITSPGGTSSGTESGGGIGSSGGTGTDKN